MSCSAMDADHASLASRISHAASSSPVDLWGNAGLYVGLGTFIVTILLESISMPCVRAIVAAPGGKMLYGQAWFYTAINSIVLGPPVYGIVAKWLVHDRTCNAGPVLCALHIFGRVVCLLFLHSFGYWYAHMTMHTSWLWWAHKFHHKFSSAVTPCVAMAVSPMEYMLAYMLPFVLGAVLLRPDGLALLLAVCVVSLSNLLVHTKRIEYVRLPWFLVSAHKHLEHHRRPNKHYSAPTFDVDAILLRLVGRGPSITVT